MGLKRFFVDFYYNNFDVPSKASVEEANKCLNRSHDRLFECIANLCSEKAQLRADNLAQSKEIDSLYALLEKLSGD